MIITCIAPVKLTAKIVNFKSLSKHCFGLSAGTNHAEDSVMEARKPEVDEPESRQGIKTGQLLIYTEQSTALRQL